MNHTLISYVALLKRTDKGPPMSFTTSSDGELSCGFESGEILSWKSDGTFLTKEIYSNNPLLHVRKFCLGGKDGTITFDSNGEVKREWNLLIFSCLELSEVLRVSQVETQHKT